jgi:putative sterol carrier protein
LDAPAEDDELRAGWAAVALRSALPAGASDGRPGTYGLRIDGEVFHLRVGGKEAEVRQGSAPDHDLVVESDAGTLLAVASGRLSPEQAVESGALRVEGEKDREALIAWCRHLVSPTDNRT